MNEKEHSTIPNISDLTIFFKKSVFTPFFHERENYSLYTLKTTNVKMMHIYPLVICFVYSLC